MHKIILKVLGGGVWSLPNVNNLYVTDVIVDGVSQGGWVSSVNLDGKDLSIIEIVFENAIYVNDNFCGYKTTLKSVEFIGLLGAIPKNSFYGCTNLEEVILNDSITVIRDAAFYQCSSLKHIVIPDSVQSIGLSAFWESGLESVVLGSGLTTISTSAFAQIPTLQHIECRSMVAPTILWTTFYTDVNPPMYGTLVYPDGADYSSWLSMEKGFLGYYNWNNSWDDKVLKCTYLVDGFGKVAIFNASSVGATDEFIAFTYNDYYGSFGTYQSYNKDMYSGVVYIMLKNPTVIPKGMFKNCKLLTDVKIPSSVQVISDEAFYYCTGLESVIIPENVTNIGNTAFFLTNLSTIMAEPAIAPTISSNTFRNVETGGTLYHPKGSDYTTWLGDGEYELGTYEWNAVGYDLDNPPLPEIPDGLRVKVTYNITSTSNKTDIYKGLDIKCIIYDGDVIQRVMGSNQLRFKAVGEQTLEFVLTDTTIGNDSFRDCTTITSVEIPDGVTNIGYEAFEGCTSLETIYVKSLTPPTIGYLTFNDISTGGTLYYPKGSDYSTWLGDGEYYLGYYGWNAKEITDNDDNMTGQEPILYAMRLDYASTGGTKYVQVDYVNPKTVKEPTCSQSWVTISKVTDGTTFDENLNLVGQYRYAITMTESSFARQTNVKFSYVAEDGQTYTEDKLMLYQAAPASTTSIELERTEVEFDSTGYAEYFGIKVTYIDASEILEPMASDDWITVSQLIPMQGQSANIKRYGIYVTETTEERSGQIVFRCKDTNGGVVYSSDVIVRQLAPVVDTTVVVSAYTQTGTVNYDGSSTGIAVTSLGCSYKNAASILEPMVSADWIHLGEGVQQSSLSEDTVVFRYPISFDTNTSVQRVGIVTFMATDAQGNEYTSTTTITQLAAPVTPDEPEPELPEDSDEITYSPIWKDIEYTFVNDEEYGIYTEMTYRFNGMSYKEDVLLFKGRAYIAPNSDRVNININKICQNYMSEAPNIFTGAVGYYHSYNEFKLKNSYGTLLHTYRFVNDWSYDTLTLGLKTNPIVPHIGDGQKLFFSAFATDRKEFKWGMRYYDGTADYDNMEVLTDDFETVVVAPSREDGVNTFYFGDKSFTVLPRCRCKYVLYYMNPYGGYDWFPITGRVTRKDKLETYTVTQNYNNTTSNFGKKRYLSTIDVNFQINTQWLTQEQSDRMWELTESNTVWLHNLEEDKIYPVVITDTEIEHKQKTRNSRMLSYQINVELSHQRERL